jgi:hypothetical protein
MNTVTGNRLALALAAMLILLAALCFVHSVAIKNDLSTPTTGRLTTSEFDAIIAETKHRIRGEEPSGFAWKALDQDKLVRLLQMPEFAALNERILGTSVKGALIDQAGRWNLLHFDKPSDAVSQFARWYPNNGYTKPFAPADKDGIAGGIFSWSMDGGAWGDESGAMVVMLDCLPRPAWHVWDTSPMIWTMEHGSIWNYTNDIDFGQCVRKQREGAEMIWSSSPDTDRGKIFADILEKKFGSYLLAHRCPDGGPDECMALLHMLQTLDPQQQQLVAIIKALEPQFGAKTELTIPAALRDRRGDSSDDDYRLVMNLRRQATNQAIFQTAKLPVLLQYPDQWPKDELEKTLHHMIDLSLLMLQTKYITVRGVPLDWDRYKYADFWGALPPVSAMPSTLTATLTELGHEFAQSHECDLAINGPEGIPTPFWDGFKKEQDNKGPKQCDNN